MTIARIARLSFYFFIIINFSIGNTWTKEEKPKHHKEVMQSALYSFIRMLPYVSSEASYTDPNNQDTIKKELYALEKIFTLAKKEAVLQQDLFSTTNTVILDNLKLAQDSLNYSNKNFSYIRMKETVNLCFHCHAQLPSDHTSTFSKGFNNLTRKKFLSDFDYAQYLFLIRNFEGAKSAYGTVVDEISKKLKDAVKKKSKVSLSDQRQLEDSLRQILIIYAKVQRDMTGGISYLSNIKTENLPSYLKQQIQSWISGLKDWENKKDSIVEIKGNKELKTFASEVLDPILAKSKDGDVKVIDLLVGTGVLSNYIFTHADDPDKALALYYLGLSENALSSTSFYSLAESYFRDCVQRYPNHSIAPKCYDEYESNIIFGFTGSSGLRLPDDVKKDLENLKKMLPGTTIKQ